MKKYQSLLFTLIYLFILSVSCISKNTNDSNQENTVPSTKAEENILPSSMLDIYKGGPVHLIPDENYGKNNDWDKLFDRYFDTITYDSDGYRKKNILLAPNGSIFMSQRNRHEIWKFDSLGNLVLRFGERGGKPHQFPMLPGVVDIIDDKYLLTSDVHSRLKLFNLDGNFIKEHRLEYGASMKYIGNNKLILNGSVIGKRWRYLIAIFDLNTGEQKIIYDYYSKATLKDLDKIYRGMSFITRRKGDSLGLKIRPSNKGKIYLPTKRAYGTKDRLILGNGNFIIADKMKGKLDIYNSEGKLIKNILLAIEPIQLTKEDAMETYQSAVASYKKGLHHFLNNPNYNLNKRQIEEIKTAYANEIQQADFLKDLSNYHPTLPVFSKILFDSEDNMLVFEFTRKEESDNKFSLVAYNSNGEILARTSFICEGYDLQFNGNRFIISNGYVYAIAYKKNATGVPVRLMRFKMVNKE